MKALSMRPPWGYLSATVKDVENRYWPLPRSFTVPQRIYIHQSLTWESGSRWFQPPYFSQRLPPHRRHEIMNTLGLMHDSYLMNRRRHPELLLVWGIGAIIGEVDITGCVHSTDIGHPATKSPWFVGPYGFLLANAVLYEKPVPYKGRLGFFEVRSFGSTADH